MRLFFDENVPRPLRRELSEHEVSFVEEQGWKGKENGELLDLIAGAFDVLLTADANMLHQQQLVGRIFSVLIVPTNNLAI